jgi:hypothetical protein
MRRREFVTLIGGIVAGWPPATRSQQQSSPIIGYVGAQSPELWASRGLCQINSAVSYTTITTILASKSLVSFVSPRRPVRHERSCGKTLT